MWICSQHGFYSIVSDAEKSGYLLVRSRDRQHLEKILDWQDSPPVLHTPDNDYPYRVSLPRDAVLWLLGDIVESIDYPNFKNRVDYNCKYGPQDSWYARALHSAWSVMFSAAQHRR
jgi:hypothetical protein